MNKITILLSSTVFIQPIKGYLVQRNHNDRLDAYLKAIKQWLDKTSFNIVLVENSGYTFDELANYKTKYKDRFQIISFIEENIKDSTYIKNCDSKGSSEMLSLSYAYYNSELVSKSEFVIKVTGRFFIPNFQEYLEQNNILNYDTICQNDRMRCEMVGCKTKYFHKLFNIHLVTLENKLCAWAELIFKERIDTFFSNTFVCKILPIEKTYRGGCIIPYTNL